MNLKAILSACLLAATAAGAQAQAAEPTPAQTDSLSRAVATVLGSYIKGSVENLEHLGGKVDTDVFVETLGRVLTVDSCPPDSTSIMPTHISSDISNRAGPHRLPIR